MKPPEPPLLLAARLLVALLFWPTVIASSCSFGVFVAIWLENSPGILLASAGLLVACAAIMMRAVRGFRLRMDSEACERTALTALLSGSAAGYIVAAHLVLGHPDQVWQPGWLELGLAGIWQVCAIVAYQWSLRKEP